MRTPDFLLCHRLHQVLLMSMAVATCQCDTGSTGYLSASGTGNKGGTVQSVGVTGETPGVGATTSGTSVAGFAADGIAIGIVLQSGGVAASVHSIGDTYWPSTVVQLGQPATGSIPAATLIVGVNDNGSCALSIPQANSVTQALRNVDANVDPNFDTLLTSLDAQNAHVVLEVQPGKADLGELATAVIAAYGAHTSVVGFGVDVQYKGTKSYSSSASLSNSEAQTLVNTISAIRPDNFFLYVKASQASNLPDSSIAKVVFINDSSGVDSLDAMMTLQKDWASTFTPASVQFDIGNPKDANWWCAADATSATTTLMKSALSAGSNVTGLYWQAAGIVQLRPSVTCVAAAAPVSVTAGSTSAGSVTGAGAATGGTTAGSTSAGATTSSATTTGTTSAGATTSGATTAGTTSAGTTTSAATTTGATSAGATTSSATTAGTTSAGTTTSGATTTGSTTSGSTTTGGATSGTSTAGSTTSSATTTGATTSASTSAGSTTAGATSTSTGGTGSATTGGGTSTETTTGSITP